MRVAFTVMGGSHWVGGRNYLVNLFRVLREYATGEVTPVLFVGDGVSAEESEAFATILEEPIIRSRLFSRRRPWGLVSPFILGREPAVEALLMEQGINVVFESAAYYGWKFRIPVVSWMPDFQHRHMSELFSAPGYWRRELGFRAQVASGRTIMVSSEAAKRDCERFYPGSIGRVHVVPFAVMAEDSTSALDVDQVRLHYGLPTTFFYLPNQFWVHKNHRIVIDAVALLKSRGTEVVVAASGQSMDPRRPGHFRFLQERVKALDIQENFRFLGLVPHGHISALMRGARAVINPSLFEGWSTTVEEAKALRLALVLSDIPVHREQTSEATFFDPFSSEDLAAALLLALERSPQMLSRLDGGMSRPEPQRFAEDFARVVSVAFVQGKLKHVP